MRVTYGDGGGGGVGRVLGSAGGGGGGVVVGGGECSPDTQRPAPGERQARVCSTNHPRPIDHFKPFYHHTVLQPLFLFVHLEQRSGKSSPGLLVCLRTVMLSMCTRVSGHDLDVN